MNVMKHIAAILVALTAMLGCARTESAAWPTQEAELLAQLQLERLQKGPMPIDKAMAALVKRGRGGHPSIAPKASQDTSSLAGWSFAGGQAGGAAPTDDTMPEDCAGQADPAACWGEKLYGSKGCIACHSLDGVQQQPAPSWKGLFGTERVLTTGATLVADEEYLRRSITEPTAELVQGYGAVMPPMNLNEAQVDAIVAYIKSL